MKILAMSDLHGHLPDIETPFDLLLICGDICPSNNHNLVYQWNWLTNSFVNWARALPYKDEYSKMVFIAGNHDFAFESSPTLGEELSGKCDRIVYLENKSYQFRHPDKHINLYGTPWCKLFGNWAFMKGTHMLDDLYEDITFGGIDILMSHDAPAIGDYGTINAGPWSGNKAGNKQLYNAIYDGSPVYSFFGHIHTGSHELQKIGATTFCNVSLLNEKYEVAFKPLILEL